MLHIFAGVKVATFAAGAVTGALGVTVLRSGTVRKLAVSTLAKGYQVKDAASEKLQSMKEDAQDLCAEAKAEACATAMEETEEESDT